MRKKNQKGFTLIELLLVVAIIGILAALAIPQFGDQPKKSKIARMVGDMATLDRAAATFKAENGDYPTAIELATLVKGGTLPTPPAGVHVKGAATVVDEYSYDETSGTSYLELADPASYKAADDAHVGTDVSSLAAWGLD